MRIMTMPSVDPDRSPSGTAGRSIAPQARSSVGRAFAPELTRLLSEPEWPDFPRRVLVVAPTESECSRLRNALVADQLEVSSARDLTTAAHAISIFEPDVIVSHLRLPTLSGLELVCRLKQDHSTRFLPVILYSDIATVEERVMALDSGAVDLLTEPFDSVELIARVRAALRTRHTFCMLERSAHLDDLTGLANRRVIDDQLRREWDACRRRGAPLAVIIIDLDHFKSINDTYGHAAGDEVLCHTARLLAQSARSSDVVGRYGGEEFVVVAPDCQLEAAAALAARFRANLANQAILASGRVIAVTASAGVAAAGGAHDSPGELLDRADKALYEVKRSGRDRVWVHDPARHGRFAAGARAAGFQCDAT
jgi:diguanylate cyclase (GGDEF)-like protein